MRKFILLSLAVLFGILLFAGCASRPTRVSDIEEFVEAIENDEDIILKKDLDFSGINWHPKAYSGSINGKGHTIKNVSVIEYSGDCIGIFSSGISGVENVNFENISIEYYGTTSDKGGVGGLVGKATNRIFVRNVTISGTITAPNAMYVGGLIGYGSSDCTVSSTSINMTICGMDGVGGAVGCTKSRAVLSAVTNLGSVTSLYSAAGGIVGASFDEETEFSNCKNAGNVSAIITAGGIVGTGRVSSMKNCTNEGTITSTMIAEKDGKTGGLGGEVVVYDTISECSNKGKVIGESVKIGGLFGVLRGEGKITECKNSAEVTGGTRVGGVIGQSSEKLQIINCRNEGIVTGKQCVGGIVGSGNENIFLSNCSNHVQITGNNYVGGIVGFLEEGFNGTICFNTNNEKIVATECAAGIVGFTSRTDIKDIDTNKNFGEIQGDRTDDIFNS